MDTNCITGCVIANKETKQLIMICVSLYFSIFLKKNLKNNVTRQISVLKLLVHLECF